MAAFTTVSIPTPDSDSAQALQLTDFSGYAYRMANLIAETGGNYTFSVWIRAETAMQVIFRVLGEVFAEQITAEWQRVVFHTKDVTETGVEIQPQSDMALYLYKGMLQKGQYDTDWKPAPEDDQDRLTNVEGRLELCVKTDENDRIVSMLNASADVIHLTSNRLRISSDNFTLTEDGRIQATAGEVGGFQLRTEKVDGTAVHCLFGGYEYAEKLYGLRLRPNSGTDEYDSTISFLSGDKAVTIQAQRQETEDGFRRLILSGAPVSAEDGLYIENQYVGDFVVSSGRDTNGWGWRKWSSGMAECWAQVNAQYANSSVLTRAVSLPFTFASVTSCTATLNNYNENAASALQWNCKVQFSTSAVHIAVHSSSGNFSSETVLPVSVRLEGCWK